MNEAGRKIVVSKSMPGQARLHLLDRLFDPARDVERVRPRELLHDEQQAGPVVDDGITEKRLVVLDDLGDVAQMDRLALGVR